MKVLSSYPGCHEVRSALSDLYQSLDRARMWRYNILGDNKGRIPHILRLDPITAGCVLLTAKLVALKRGNIEPILTVKRTEWRKFIDYFGLSIEAEPSRKVKNNVYFPLKGYIPITSFVKSHTAMHHMDK